VKPKILLVHDDDSYRQHLKLDLEQAGYQVVTAPNGKIAQSLVTIYDNFAACISRIELPEVDGLALLQFIQRTRPMPVILITDHSGIQNEKQVLELGAARLFIKPLKEAELQSALQDCLRIMPLQHEETNFNKDKDKNQDKNKEKDEDFCHIYIHDFISGKELQYDIFIRLTSQKYLKVAHQGSTFTLENLNTYKARNIEYLYMAKEDFKKYVGFSVSLSNSVTSSPSLPKAKKVQFIKHATEMIATQLHLDGVDEASFDNAKSVLDSTLSVMSDSHELVSMLGMLNSASDTTYSHSIGVSLYSTMLARAVGMNSPLVLFKVSMGGMVHDIGKKELPSEILNKPRHLLDAQEMRLYESHTVRGAEILGQLPFVPDEIIKITAQHHENCLGMGYPAGLRMDFIHPLARLVSVANEFCNLAIRGPHTPALSPTEALGRMSLIYIDTLDPVFFVALAKLFHFQIDPSYFNALRLRKHSDSSTTPASG
jgi:putative nucleotidyltransferase with HDIG domain